MDNKKEKLLKVIDEKLLNCDTERKEELFLLFNEQELELMRQWVVEVTGVDVFDENEEALDYFILISYITERTVKEMREYKYIDAVHFFNLYLVMRNF